MLYRFFYSAARPSDFLLSGPGNHILPVPARLIAPPILDPIL